MGPSAREILHRIEAGQRVSPAQARAAVMLLHDAYDRVVCLVDDALSRDDGIRSSTAPVVLHDIRGLLLVSEVMLRNNDLTVAYTGISEAKSVLTRASAPEKSNETLASGSAGTHPSMNRA